MMTGVGENRGLHRVLRERVRSARIGVLRESDWKGRGLPGYLTLSVVFDIGKMCRRDGDASPATVISVSSPSAYKDL